MGTRRHARYTLLNRPAVRAQWDSAAGTIATSADLLDLSRGGAKLSLYASPIIGTSLTLHFDDLAAAVPSTVCWSRAEGDRSWAACSFEPPLEDSLFESLLQ